MSFREILPTQIQGNFIDMVSNGWMLIAAKHEGRVNMMTASWGSIGYFWRMPVAACVIRRERFTHPMIDAGQTFSLTFFDESWHDQLEICGRQSGRDIDKVETCGFDVLYDGETPYFEQAKLVIICRKVAKLPFGADMFIDPEIAPKHYSAGNFHDMFFGEITKVLVKE